MALTFEFERQRRADRLTFLPDNEHEVPPAAGGLFDAGACGNGLDPQGGGTDFMHGNLLMTWAIFRAHRGRARNQLSVLMEQSFQQMH